MIIKTYFISHTKNTIIHLTHYTFDFPEHPKKKSPSLSWTVAAINIPTKKVSKGHLGHLPSFIGWSPLKWAACVGSRNFGTRTPSALPPCRNKTALAHVIKLLTRVCAKWKIDPNRLESINFLKFSVWFKNNNP